MTPLEFILIGVSVALAAYCAYLLFKNFERKKLDAERGENDENISRLRLQAAELADRLRIVHEQQAIAATDLTRLVGRLDGSAFVALENRAAAKRLSKMLAAEAKTALNDVRRAMLIAGQSVKPIDSWPSLETLSEMFSEYEDKGVVINFEESGDRFALSSSAELAIYRIISEALENVKQHGAAGAEADIRMTWSEYGLSFTIDDDGQSVAARRATASGEENPERVSIESDHKALVSDHEGRGISEMVSRAAAFDGIVKTAVVPGVGFSVSVSFPVLKHRTDPNPEPVD